jgi:hypothetical protein
MTIVEKASTQYPQIVESRRLSCTQRRELISMHILNTTVYKREPTETFHFFEEGYKRRCIDLSCLTWSPV